MIYHFSEYVEDFLCISDPPGPYDSIEESRVSQIIEFCYKSEIELSLKTVVVV